MKRAALIMTLVMLTGQMAAVVETQPQSAKYYGWCDLEGCTAAAIHTHDERVCLPGHGYYGGYGNSENYGSYDNGGNYDNYNNYYNSGNYQGYHHSEHQGGHHR